MNTYRIDKKELKNKKVLAEGYKIFYQGFKTKHGDYCYADENGNVVGTFHKVEGEIEECNWGLHFSKNPFDCFSFYECVQWNEFAKVRAYEKIINAGEKTVAQVIEIVETYTFNEFLEVLKKYNKEKYLSNGVNWSYGVNSSNGVNRSYGVIKSQVITKSIFCFNTSGKLKLFNKKISEERFKEIIENINNFRWYPRFNNLIDMKEEKQYWYKVNIPSVFEIDNKTAWSTMPEKMKEYIKSLPEYSERIFKRITGDLKDDNN